VGTLVSSARASRVLSVEAVSVAPFAAFTAPVTPPPIAPRPQVPISTVLARPAGAAATYTAPGGTLTGYVGLWYGYPLVLPVLSQQPGWLQVRLPQRPNQSTGWVKTSDVALSSTPYRIVVDVGAQQLHVFRAGYQIVDLPVGVGTPATPTVTGHYFVTVKAPPPNSGYGAFVLSTSAHSEAIQSWEGSGDALIAIHGPIDSYADSLIGTGRARVSNGCIRMHKTDLLQLADVPIGTPLDINP
jgi:lipoprotein-anchoring transpeptidase ErfK/SrfK